MNYDLTFNVVYTKKEKEYNDNIILLLLPLLCLLNNYDTA